MHLGITRLSDCLTCYNFCVFLCGVEKKCHTLLQSIRYCLCHCLTCGFHDHLQLTAELCGQFSVFQFNHSDKL